MTLQLGVRYDHNHDQALAVDGSRPDRSCRPSLPAVSFAGADPGVVFHNFSPRIGLTYNIRGDGKTLRRSNYAHATAARSATAASRASQPGDARSPLDTRGSTRTSDTFVQPSEIYDSKGVPRFRAVTRRISADPGTGIRANPGSPTTPNTVDPNLKNDRTDEFIVGFDREVGSGFAVGGNYIWRRYANCFSNACPGWAPLNGVATDGSSYTAVSTCRRPQPARRARAARR